MYVYIYMYGSGVFTYDGYVVISQTTSDHHLVEPAPRAMSCRGRPSLMCRDEQEYYIASYIAISMQVLHYIYMYIIYNICNAYI